jgi:hypothetical protein
MYCIYTDARIRCKVTKIQLFFAKKFEAPMPIAPGKIKATYGGTLFDQMLDMTLEHAMRTGFRIRNCP